MMSFDYEYAEMPMSIEIHGKQDCFLLIHRQNSSKSSRGLLNMLFSVRYRAKMTLDQILFLKEALQSREPGKIEISKKFYVIRSEEKFSTVYFKFPDALEKVPLPRAASDKLIGLISDNFFS